ncbi:MAG: hypothetical protein JOZ43_00310 [Acidobacteriales bacterium]|nr:hypothetical protein [Terriglobales bacterium]
MFFTSAAAQQPANHFANAASSIPSLKARPHTMLPGPKDPVLLRAHGRIPLGAESFLLGGAKRPATIMALAQLPQLGDILVFEHNHKKYVVHPDGSPVTQLPGHITFRITASSLVNVQDRPVTLDSHEPVEDFLRQLTFVARLSRAGDLFSTRVEPTRVRQIGIPPNIPAAERVYRAEFDLGKLSVDDHVVLEVNGENGEPLTKFVLPLK